MGQSIEQIKTNFNIVNDPSPDQIAESKLKRPWAFDKKLRDRHFSSIKIQSVARMFLQKRRNLRAKSHFEKCWDKHKHDIARKNTNMMFGLF